MKENEPMKRMLRLVHCYDEDFINEWEDTLRKGLFRHILKTTTITTAMMSIIGIFFLLNKCSMYGFEQSQTILVALSQGLILGIILSLIQWGLGNDRYNRLKEKKS